MSKNYDLIATVSIDLATPIVDDTSFDNILIVGPPPGAAPEKAPPKFGAYASFDEVQSAGWLASGDNPDPVGVAAQVAFGQSPRPGCIYIAPLQLTPEAVASGKAISRIEKAAKEHVHTGAESGAEGCTVALDMEKRVISITLKGDVGSVKNTGLVTFGKAVQAYGYKGIIEGTEITDVAGLMSSSVYKEIQQLNTESDEKVVQFTLHVTGEDGADVPIGVVVWRPTTEHQTSPAPEFTKEELGRPQDELEHVVTTLGRVAGNSSWYVLCPAGVSQEEYPEIAAFIETQEKLFCYTELDFFNHLDEDDNPQPTVDNVYLRTLGVYGRETADQPDEEIPAANRYMNVAFCIRWLNYASGSETSAFKTLTTVSPSELTSTEMKQLEAASVNYFIKVGNRNVTMNGKVLGDEWADVIRFRDWLKNDMQVRVVNLFITNPKIPYTDPGIALVQNEMISSLKAGVEAGGIAPVEYTENGEEIPSYTTSVPLASSLTPSERASRKLTRCYFSARLAGAIHFAELKGTLAYEL